MLATLELHLAPRPLTLLCMSVNWIAGHAMDSSRISVICLSWTINDGAVEDGNISRHDTRLGLLVNIRVGRVRGRTRPLFQHLPGLFERACGQ